MATHGRGGRLVRDAAEPYRVVGRQRLGAGRCQREHRYGDALLVHRRDPFLTEVGESLAVVASFVERETVVAALNSGGQRGA